MQVAFKIHVAIDPDAASRVQQQRSITGRLSLQLGDLWFPSEAWNDFVLDVLGSMARTLVLLRDEVIEVHTHFMEGPYELYCRRRAGSRALVLSCVRDGQSALSAPAHVDRRRYEAEISAAGAQVLAQLANLGLSRSRPASRFRRLLTRMRREEQARREEGYLGW